MKTLSIFAITAVLVAGGFTITHRTDSAASSIGGNPVPECGNPFDCTPPQSGGTPPARSQR